MQSGAEVASSLKSGRKRRMMHETTTSPVRVLYVESSRDGTVGGSHMSLLHLVTGIKARGFAPIVVFGSSHSLMHRFDRLGIKTIVLPAHTPFRARSAVIRPFVRGFNFLSMQLHRLLSIVKFWSIMAKERVQLV